MTAAGPTRSASVRVVLLDLDDTLYDHRHCSQMGLAALREAYGELAHVDAYQLERAYLELLNRYHRDVLAGRLTPEQARKARFRELLGRYGLSVGDGEASVASARYHAAYRGSERPVPGAQALLTALGGRVRRVVVTNNLLAAQQAKLRACGIEDLIDDLVTSEEVGSAKPDPAIFAVALELARCRADEAVMLGDAWESDVAGARAAGIRAVWLNRYGDPCPDPAWASEIRALLPTRDMVRLLLAP